MTAITRRLAVVLVALSLTASVQAQEVVKYGGEFLASGVGARALGMGGAFVSHADDATAGYWNVAGLNGVAQPEAVYMHAERFDGAVSFDYAAVAYPLTSRSTVAISLFRSAVDDIANTLDALDSNGQLNPDRIELFSASDNALFVSYARGVGDKLSLGATAKVVYRGVGDFGSAWGYSLDLGAQADLGRVRLGVNLQDISTMVQSWSVDAERFAQVEEASRPIGLTEIVLPVVRLGASTAVPLSDDIGLTLATDLDLMFDGRVANALDAGGVSFHPRAGAEMTYRDILAFRLGIIDVASNETFGTQLTPTAGVGIRVGDLGVDYGFGDFGGLASELGYAHRVSLAYRFGGGAGPSVPTSN